MSIFMRCGTACFIEEMGDGDDTITIAPRLGP
jgi:hypothetical protein